MKNNHKNKLIIFSIVLIILNVLLIINKIGIVKENKQIIKEMTEGEYESKLTELNTSHEDYALTVQENKRKISTAISNQKVTTSENATIDEMVTNIGKIIQEGTADATATSADITEGKTAYVNGELIKGTKNKEIEKLYLYKEGNEYTDITGGWSATTKYSNYMLAKGYNGAYTQNTIDVDLSKYSYFAVEVSSTGTMMGTIRLHTTNSASTQDEWARDARVMAGNNNSGYMNFADDTGATCIYKCALNNLDLNLEYYVTAFGSTSYAEGMKIHNIWLE